MRQRSAILPPHRPSPPRALALALALAAAALAAPPAVAARHEAGDRIVVSGVVTDPTGAPVEDVRVVLEASRTVFSLRQFRPVDRDTTRVAALTDERGQFTLSWPWDSFYNHFELIAGVPVRTPEGETLQPLERVDVTRRLARDAGIVVPVVLDARDADFVAHLRAFLATIDSADEQRVHRQLGKPDRVEIRGGEESWWYFARGRRYDFSDGRLAEVKSFEPVPGP